MRLLHNFLCEKCGTEQERYIDANITQVICECGHTAVRLMGMPRVALDGTDPGFPTAYERWANVREQNRSVHARRDR